MLADEYQKTTQSTDQFRNPNSSLNRSVNKIVKSVTLLSKRYDSIDKSNIHTDDFLSYIVDELGDILWYTADIADSLELSLSDIMIKNLNKNKKEWGDKVHSSAKYDQGYPSTEVMPRETLFRINDLDGNAELLIQDKYDNWIRLGDRITNNSFEEDGYRFHDVIHLSFMTFLEWSPTMRALLNRKRKTNIDVDIVEDGARACDLEEAISALVFEYARESNWFQSADYVPLELLTLIERITKNLEVSRATFSVWQQAILEGYKIFRKVRENCGGYIKCNLDKKTIEYSLKNNF